MRRPSVEELEPQLEALHRASFAWAARCCGGNRDEAEDVLQTTYLKLLEGRARYSGRSSFKTWLFGVIRKTAADQRRRRALRERLLGLFGRTQPQREPPAPPDEIIASGENRQRLVGALERLSPRQAQIVDLVFAHELSVADAAGVLGISVGSARTHYHRAKQQLADLLGEGALP
jgi:RNA polymerase sigma-70 factor (ECF subfamily)